MKKIGTIKEIWRYPVKGMAGESVDSCGLSERGLEGDRIWALRDTARQEIQSCKFRPDLLRCSASLTSNSISDPTDQLTIIFPDGSELSCTDPLTNTRLSELVGHPSTLESLRPVSDLGFYRRHKRDSHTWLDELKATFEREPGESLPDLDNLPQQAVDFVSLPGTFFLVTPFHIVTTSTLNHLSRFAPESDWDLRRFRPNVVIDTQEKHSGLIEQGWLGKVLTIGTSTIDCTATTPRCGAITRPQNDFEQDKTILRKIVKHANQNLGIYGDITNPGHIQVGDPVYIQ